LLFCCCTNQGKNATTEISDSFPVPSPLLWEQNCHSVPHLKKYMSASQIRLNLSEGSVIFNFTPSAARELQASILALMNSLKTASVQGGGKPAPQKPMEYQYAGDVFLEIFCNPNIWASPFAAKVLVTLRDDRIRISTEADLTRLNEDISQYLEQFG
jgi:hypothetical protein